MYTLVGSAKTRAFRVLWCLEEMGLEYVHQPALPHAAEISEHNPTGKVPALLVGDDVVLDSVAIMQFLADKHGALTAKAGTLERAHQDSWSQFALDEMDAPLWTDGKHRFFLPDNFQLLLQYWPLWSCQYSLLKPWRRPIQKGSSPGQS